MICGLLIWNVEILLQTAMPIPDLVVDPSHHFLCDDWNVEMRQTMTYFTSSCH